MPYYQFTISEGSSSAKHKAEIAEAITDVHCEMTGVDPIFVSVSFVEVPRDGLYLAGKPVSGARMVGLIRRRPEEAKRELLLRLGKAWSTATGEPFDSAIMFLVDIPGQQALENGELLPDTDEHLAALGLG